jgi:uncharacterized protein (TIGR02453 family)
MERNEGDDMASKNNPFGPRLLAFLKDIESNNNAGWFQANKHRYESDVREPALEFVRMMAPHVHRISPCLVASDKKVGGSLMRIYRDVRFSRNKQPYKTNVGIQFRHVDGKDVHAPGLYFHVDPRSVFLGAGMWHPEAKALAAVRVSIDDDPERWKRVRDGKRFRDVWEPSGDSLRTAPRGYPKDHPMIEDLRRKDHIAICDLTHGDVVRPDLVPFVSEKFRRARPYMAWQAEALGIPF